MIEVTVRGSHQSYDWVVNALVKQSKMYPSGLLARTYAHSTIQKTNLNALKKMTAVGAKIHHGFRLQFLSLVEMLDTALAPYDNWLRAGDTKIAFYGHSLGGAVTQLLALHTALRLRINPEVVTFGSPRVGNPAWAAFSEKHVRHYRFKFLVDLVAELPPKKVLGARYQHSDYLHYGFVIAPWNTAQRARSHKSPYQVVCPGECTLARVEPQLMLATHAADFSYEQAASYIWLWMRDSFNIPYTYMQETAKQNQEALKLMDVVYSSALDVKRAVQTVTCAADAFCEFTREFPGVPVEKQEQCLKTVIRKFEGNRYLNKVMSENKDILESEHATPEETPYRSAALLLKVVALQSQVTARRPALKLLGSCVKPQVKSGFYKHFELQDWQQCWGNMVLINRRRAIVEAEQS